jgi:hypothetical protein
MELINCDGLFTDVLISKKEEKKEGGGALDTTCLKNWNTDNHKFIWF